MSQDPFQREERRLIVALGFLATVIAARPLTAGVVVFYIKLDVFIDWLLIPPWLVYGLFMWVWFSDDLFTRGRRLFHVLGLSALAVQIFAVLLLFGVTGIAVYAPPIPVWLDPYLIDGYVVLISVGLGSALRAIVRAEGLQAVLSKNADRFFALAQGGGQFVGEQLVYGWRKLLGKIGRRSTGPVNTRRAERLLILAITVVVIGAGWSVFGLSWVALSYALAATLGSVVVCYAFIGWLVTGRDQGLKTRVDSSGELPESLGSQTVPESGGKRGLRRFLFLAMAIGLSYVISVLIIIGVVLTIAPGSWFRTFRVIGLVFNIAGAFASLVPRAVREADDIDAQSGTYVGHNPHLRTSLRRDTRVAQVGIALLAVGFIQQLIGNLG